MLEPISSNRTETMFWSESVSHLWDTLAAHQKSFRLLRFQKLQKLILRSLHTMWNYSRSKNRALFLTICYKAISSANLLQQIILYFMGYYDRKPIPPFRQVVKWSHEYKRGFVKQWAEEWKKKEIFFFFLPRHNNIHFKISKHFRSTVIKLPISPCSIKDF